MTVTVAASELAIGDVLDGRPITGLYRGWRHVNVAPHGWKYHDIDSVVLDRRAVPSCPRCGARLDPAVFHDDDDDGEQVCGGCCRTCNPDLPDGDAYDEWVERQLSRPAPGPDTLTGMAGR